MSQSVVINAADQVAEFLSSQTFGRKSIPFARKLIPQKNLAEAKEVGGYVVPNSMTQNLTARGTREYLITLDIGIMCRASENQLEKLLGVTQQVGDCLDGQDFLPDNFRVLEVTYNPLYDVDSWLELHSFVSVISIKIIYSKEN